MSITIFSGQYSNTFDLFPQFPSVHLFDGNKNNVVRHLKRANGGLYVPTAGTPTRFVSTVLSDRNTLLSNQHRSYGHERRF